MQTSYVQERAVGGDPVAKSIAENPRISPEVFRHAKARLKKLGLTWNDLRINSPGPLTIADVDEVIDSIGKRLGARREGGRQ